MKGGAGPLSARESKPKRGSGSCAAGLVYAFPGNAQITLPPLICFPKFRNAIETERV